MGVRSRGHGEKGWVLGEKGVGARRHGKKGVGSWREGGTWRHGG